ncbi:MAG TPA: biopolymer transporter ExbD [Phycisphaerales bacterium]|nr:biopolymer transporter ExbD [Phycisphaerales bacterium]
MQFRRSPDPPEAGFDLTPMIDIVLLLIVFFTMTAHFARTSGTPVDLPKQPGEVTEKTSDHQIIIDIDSRGGYVLLGRLLPLTDISSQVKSEVERIGGSPDVLIRADRKCPSMHLNRLAVALASAGVRQWKLATAGAAQETSGTGGGA